MIEIPKAKYFFSLILIIAMMIIALVDFENKMKVFCLLLFFFSGLVADDLFHHYKKDSNAN